MAAWLRAYWYGWNGAPGWVSSGLSSVQAGSPTCLVMSGSAVLAKKLGQHQRAGLDVPANQGALQ
jgi:hypothetical protein